MSPASILDLIAVFIFALTGGLVASRAQLDVVGFLFLACLTGVGGGTLRDLVLGRDPVFWVGSPHYLAVACAAAILAFFTAHRLESRCQAIVWLDALALSVAAAAGVSIAREAGASWPIVLVMGVATGTFGGPGARRGHQRDPAGPAAGGALRQRLPRRRAPERPAALPASGLRKVDGGPVIAGKIRRRLR